MTLESLCDNQHLPTVYLVNVQTHNVIGSYLVNLIDEKVERLASPSVSRTEAVNRGCGYIQMNATHTVSASEY